MGEKSMKSKNEATCQNSPGGRRGFLKTLALFGVGSGIGVASTPAQAGLLDSLLSIVKKLLKAAVVGIALFYAWRFLMNSSEAIKNWIEKQIDNDKKNNQDNVVVKAKFADFVNMGESVIENAEIMAAYDPPDDGCDLISMGQFSRALTGRKQQTAKKISAEVGYLEKLQIERQLPDGYHKTKVDNIRANAPMIINNVDLLIGRRGFSIEEQGQMTDLLQTLMGNIHDMPQPLDKKNMGEYTAKQWVRYALTEVYSRRVKNDDLTESFIDAQTVDTAKELARTLSKDGVSHVDVLNFNAQRYGLTPYNIFSIQVKPSPIPVFKKLLHVKAGQEALANEYHELIKLRKNLQAMQSIESQKGVA